MHDTIGRDLIENACHRGKVCEVDLVEFEPWTMLERCKARTLQRRIVVWSEHINSYDLLAARQQPFANVHSDKAGSTGNDHWPQGCHLVHSVSAMPDQD